MTEPPSPDSPVPRSFLVEYQQEVDEHNVNLRAKAKKREELIIPLEGLIEEVHGYALRGQFTPSSEMRLGGTSPSYGTFSEYTELKMSSDLPVQRITMDGLLPLEAGDYIRAYVLRGTEEMERTRGLSTRNYDRMCIPKHWVEREWKEEEKALKIEKIRENKVVATYLTYQETQLSQAEDEVPEE